jgi:EpsI family protein
MRERATMRAFMRRYQPFILLGAMLLAVAGAAALRPAMPVESPVDLAALVPDHFGPWRRIQTPFVQIDLSPTREDGAPSPYDRTLMRTYVGPKGDIIMLALAYGARQRQEVKIHRPELCYVAQGFHVGPRTPESIALSSGHALNATRMLARNDHRVEPVTYWIRIGDHISHSAWQSRTSIFRAGLAGHVPDGILVRASQAFPRGQANVERSFEVQAQFLRDLYQSLDQRARALIAGSTGAGHAG